MTSPALLSTAEYEDLGRELGSVQVHLQAVSRLLQCRAGETATATLRANEAEAAVQRLLWQLCREAHPNAHLEELWAQVESHLRQTAH